MDYFAASTLDPRLKWFCEPPSWRFDKDRHCLVIEPATDTDFWQRTHYGFSADNGHFLHAGIEGDFAMSSTVRFFPKNLYDQAGLMVRANADCWIKTAVEHESDGPARLGAVVTNHGYSDWSVQDFPRGDGEVSLRITRAGADFTVEFQRPGEAAWQLLRITHLHLPPAAAPLQCGIYACSPKGAGFRAEFYGLNIRLLLSDSLDSTADQ